MIIDGVEVLYTMRNGKIVDPNIPMNGLVCYLDTRGKYNTDIYRNALLDLSGNGNPGTLQNFNFTEESGYVKGLSGEGTSGLQFDGVDDILIYRHNLKETDPQASTGDYHFDPKYTYPRGKRKINRAMLYNRVLTDEEIQQLLTD